ncbi:SUMF1/EgtB/PvdO family nonheme iron enzyme [Streptomyces sp. NPDC049577]|uniref:formylglycine-generating enzyme family protein n=1 Tax=Streptomyces sp. NPDC049577 TaxID=3155153 RepID=UPI00343E9C29
MSGLRLEDLATSPNFKEHAPLLCPRTLRPSEDVVEELRRADPKQLAVIVENPEAPLAERLAAGGVLALLGDPRIGHQPHMSFVPGGHVEIGLREEEVEPVVKEWEHVGVEASWIEKETPQRAVRIDDFWIGTYPVTNWEYRNFLEHANREVRPTTWYLGAYPYDRGNHPVAGIRAEDADDYVAWLSETTGHPWRLPTEAEWEHAAKGVSGSEFPWGTDFDPGAANTRESGVHQTTPVGAFPAGRAACGAYDMGGNVEEYVADPYVPYPGGPYVADHLVQTLGEEYRVARGGSFSRFGDLTRTRRRHGAFPGPLYPVGLRIATSVQPQSPTE